MYLLFDIGGTNTKMAISKDGENLSEVKIFETPQDFNDGMTVFKKTVLEITGGEKIIAIAGGIAGPLNREKTKLVNSPNLPDWINKPLTGFIGEALNAPVYLENDTALVGLGEAVIGAGKSKEIVAYVTVSTGVAGVRVVDGRIDKNVYGFEIGHQVIDEAGSFTLEDRISGSGLMKRYGKKLYEITDPKILEEEDRFLAYGLNNTIVYWSPDIVVVGGSMVTKGPGISMDRVREYLSKTLTIFPEIPPVVVAELGDIGGLHGALVFLKQKLSGGK